MIKFIGVLSVVAAFLTGGMVYQNLDVSKQAKLTELGQQVLRTQQTCIQEPARQIPTLPLDDQGRFSLLVWNIYKQNTPGWKGALTELSQDKELILLQESSLTAELSDWVSNQHLRALQVRAFRFLSQDAGVMTMAKVLPRRACGFLQSEPWLRLPKSLLITEYTLSTGQTLQVVNLHAINFTLSTQDYRQQLQVALEQLSPSSPAIVAGDFNTWSPERRAVVADLLQGPSWQEVAFTPDKRSRFFGRAVLDHVFYRGLSVIHAQATHSDASDHNPLQVSFSLSAD
ncbi:MULTISPECIES: endonuclease/exonuclease/phosphatase family protein [unclassified Vibrio]|uniref:Endonuclease/exonuclease/phosphatase family protein n=1 Tax=Vibrio sp. HB236076 TaxID=3232307 RepID=A0AB39HGN8_9VIBR|nr:endonuclease/exonuclease/phosphatase family protein [Vibrio sp. HB161653]MDP5254839.1 endonuclease/exonuclease/phosphatase family protein [Vibrio sp. HB161653]